MAATKALKREVAMGVLQMSGEDAFYLQLKGALYNYEAVRAALVPLLRNVIQSRRFKYARIAVGRKTQLRLWLGTPVLATLPGKGKDAKDLTYPPGTPQALARALTKMIRGDVERLARVLAGIDRARKLLFRLAEEGTRTGPT
jgi:hypothetical protein